MSDYGRVSYHSNCVHAQECRHSWLVQDCQEVMCDWQSCGRGITERELLVCGTVNRLTLALAL